MAHQSVAAISGVALTSRPKRAFWREFTSASLPGSGGIADDSAVTGIVATDLAGVVEQVGGRGNSRVGKDEGKREYWEAHGSSGGNKISTGTHRATHPFAVENTRKGKQVLHRCQEYVTSKT